MGQGGGACCSGTSGLEFHICNLTTIASTSNECPHLSYVEIPLIRCEVNVLGGRGYSHNGLLSEAEGFADPETLYRETMHSALNLLCLSGHPLSQILGGAAVSSHYYQLGVICTVPPPSSWDKGCPD